MRRLFLTLLSLAVLTVVAVSVWAACNPYSMNVCCEVLACTSDVQTKSEFWTAYFEPNETRDRKVFGFAHVSSCQNPNCWPDFELATVTHGRDSLGRPTWKWVKKVHNKDAHCNRISPPVEFDMNYTCRLEAEECEASGGTYNFDTNNCESGGGCVDYVCPVRACAYGMNTCTCQCNQAPYSPVVLDVLGDGFSLTGYEGGVRFDLDGDGAAERLAWTAANSDDAWLALDRDGDGTIGSGAELFGNYTPQQPCDEPNGFLALAEFDKAARGGNSDGVIDARDSVFTSLRLWRDTSHDGRSQPSELFTLPALDIARLHLDYKESKRADEYGNEFRYRAKVEDARGARAGRWAWDVFLRAAP